MFLKTHKKIQVLDKLSFQKRTNSKKYLTISSTCYNSQCSLKIFLKSSIFNHQNSIFIDFIACSCSILVCLKSFFVPFQYSFNLFSCLIHLDNFQKDKQKNFIFSGFTLFILYYSKTKNMTQLCLCYVNLWISLLHPLNSLSILFIYFFFILCLTQYLFPFILYV